jgi:hypothetical protein
MTCAGASVLGYGVCLVGFGAFATVCPGALLDFFGVARPAEDVWIRVVGWLTTALGLYYLAAAWRAMAEFYFVTVIVRAAAVVVFIALVLGADAPWQLLIFAAVDGIAALLTYFFLHHEAKAAAAKAPEIAGNPG